MTATAATADPGRRLRIASIVGTRPEAIKIAPIALAARARPAIDHRIVATGQHHALFDDAIAAFGVTVAAHLGADDPGAGLDAQVAVLRAAVTRHLTDDRPDLVLVQGDTNSAYAAALAADALGIPVGHVEAGLRTHVPDRPWPEERNRRAIDALATLLFAPTKGNAANLKDCAGEIHVTGNTGIDALRRIAPTLLAAPAPARRTVLVTCHRRENFGAPLRDICRAIRSLADRGDVDIRLPLHPNPAVQAPIVERLRGHPRIALEDPLDYPAMLAAIRDAWLILSDSGGIQEEAPAFGTPLLVMRTETERPEAISGGHARLVGNDPALIVAEATRLLDQPMAHATMAHPGLPFGDGHAAGRILDTIETKLRDRTRAGDRPCRAAAPPRSFRSQKKL